MLTKERKADQQEVRLFGVVCLPQKLARELGDHDKVATNRVLNFLQRHSRIKVVEKKAA